MKRLAENLSPESPKSETEKPEESFSFLTPGELVYALPCSSLSLSDDDLTLVLKNTKVVTMENWSMPCYEFEMRHTVEGHVLGDVLLRACQPDFIGVRRWGEHGAYLSDLEATSATASAQQAVGGTIARGAVAFSFLLAVNWA